MFNYHSFSHGQVLSKIWLCENLEPYININSIIYNLGSWYNVLGLMLSMRNPYKFERVIGIDVDPEAILVADQMTKYGIFEKPLIENYCYDANTYQIPYDENTIVVNCSGEHFENKKWFETIPKGTTVCIQSTNVLDQNDPWYVKQPTPDLKSFLDAYPIGDIYYSGAKNISYTDWGYERYMVIGKK